MWSTKVRFLSPLSFDEKSYFFEKLYRGFFPGFLTAPILYPEFVTISSHGPDSVYVEWRGVSTGLYEETLWGYKVCFFVCWVPNDHSILSKAPLFYHSLTRGRATQACTTTSGERMPFYVIGLISIRRGNSLLTVCNMLSILNRWGIGCKATIFGQQTIPLLGKKLKGLFMEFSGVTCIPWGFSDSVKAGMGKWAQPNILRLVSKV